MCGFVTFLIMKRNLMTQLKSWQVAPDRKPLILMGVRQTGKTYLLEEFGRSCFRHYHIINFEEQKQVCSLFDNNLDPKKIINDLRFYLKSDIDIHKDLVIFDEIQACPKALTSLKYFCENMPELALCSAGSLLGLHLNEGSYPVGKVDIKHLHPMTFTEFLNGIGEEQITEYLDNLGFESNIPNVIHQELWEHLKYYFICGGMPEVVATFANEKNNLYHAMSRARIKQNELIKGYYADIAKHAGKINAMHLDRTWRAIPKQLAESQDSSTPRFKFKGIIPNINRYSQLVNVIDWLEAAELAIKISVVHNVEQPLEAFSKENIFKLMMFDVGILGALSGLSAEAILSYNYGTYKGYFAENFVVQQLNAQENKKIYNWQHEHSEIEFLFEHRGEIIPIEVKSGKIIHAKSLDKYIKKYTPKTSIILSGNPIYRNEKSNILHLPLYLADKTVSILFNLGE